MKNLADILPILSPLSLFIYLRIYLFIYYLRIIFYMISYERNIMDTLLYSA